MEMSGEFDVDSDAATVYSKLKDIESLAKSIPGVLKYEKHGDGKIRAEVEVGMSFIKGKFNTEIGVEEKTPGKELRMFGKGSGAGSSMNFNALFSLEEAGESTKVKWNVSINIGGLAATVGSRMVQRASDKYVNDLVAAFKKACEQD